MVVEPARISYNSKRKKSSKLEMASIAELPFNATIEAERISSVSTGWRVSWTAMECARDLWQNFVDANRTRRNDIEVKTIGDTIEVTAPATMDLDHAYFLGSTKSPDDGDIGFFGEGLKVACLCLLRDFGVRLAILSDDQAVEITIDESVNSIGLRPLVYRYYRLKQRQPGTRLVIERTSDELQEAFVNAHLNFFSAEHPWLSDRIAGDLNSIYVARTKGNRPGAIFYRWLKRADIELPMILAINKPYKSIDDLTQRDRDRNAFGEKLVTTFYRTIVGSGTVYHNNGLQEILELSRSFWEPGHALLAHMLNKQTYRCELPSDLFGDQYYAADNRISRMDYATMIPVMDIESAWKHAGRKKLPHYFRNVGVRSPLDEWETRQRLSREEAEIKLKAKRRGPTLAERACIDLLEEVMRDYDQSLAKVVLRGASYLIADTDELLGAWRCSRQYNIREIYLAARLFEGPFRTAFATHLHEVSHLFGRDGSRGFTDALTQLIESIAQRPSRLKVYSHRWAKLRASVRSERAAESIQSIARLDVDSTTNVKFAIEMLSAMPMAMAQEAIAQYLSKRTLVLAEVLTRPKESAGDLPSSSTEADYTSELPF